MGDGDISNGRIGIYKLALTEFLNSPIVGNGIGTFTINGEHSYPHNVIIQMLYESGIIYTIILCIPVAVFIRRLFNRGLDDANKIVAMFLLCLSFIGLMLSSYYWNQQAFWLIVGFGISYSNKYSILNDDAIK